MGGTDLGELREDFVLEVGEFLEDSVSPMRALSSFIRGLGRREIYRDSFNDKVYVRQILDLGAGCQALPGRRRVLFGYSAFANILFQKLVGEFQAFVNGSLRVVDDSYWQRCLLGGNEGYSKSLQWSAHALGVICNVRGTICPAPMTPSFLTSAAAFTFGVEVKVRHCCLAAHCSARRGAMESIFSIDHSKVTSWWRIGGGNNTQHVNCLHVSETRASHVVRLGPMTTGAEV